MQLPSAEVQFYESASSTPLAVLPATTVPAIGDVVTIQGRRFTTVNVEWEICLPIVAVSYVGNPPQQFMRAHVRLSSVLAQRRVTTLTDLDDAPDGTGVVWHFPDHPAEPYIDQKTPDGWLRTARAALIDWIDSGYSCEIIWLPGVDARAEGLNER